MTRSAVAGFLWFIAAVALCSCRTETPCSKHGVKAEVEGAPEHRLLIPPAAIERGTGGVYRIEGAEHEHAIKLTADDFRRLANGERVEALTTSVEAHVHNAIVRCGP